MKKLTYMSVAMIALMLVALLSGCESEKIVQSTEYVEKTEYVELPPDTVRLVDSIVIYDSVTVQSVDTVFQVQYVYDTTHRVDTVMQAQCMPNEFLAFSAMQYYSDSEVLAFINTEYGISDGWVLYLSTFQSQVSATSASSFTFSGVIDYWTPDWAEFLAIEYGWQITHVSGDPADPRNWRLDEPAGISNGKTPGLRQLNSAATLSQSAPAGN